jgi:hypothetical protein
VTRCGVPVAGVKLGGPWEPTANAPDADSRPAAATVATTADRAAVRRVEITANTFQWTWRRTLGFRVRISRY